MFSISHSLRAPSLVIAVFGFASGAAVAAGDTQAAWNGIMENKASTSACATLGGTGVGDIHISVYRPHILSTDTPTYLAIVFGRAEFTFQNGSEAANPQMRGSGSGTVTFINGKGKPGTYAGTYSNIVVSPNPVLGSTDTVTVTGTINSYFDFSGCNVTFKAVYTKE